MRKDGKIKRSNQLAAQDRHLSKSKMVDPEAVKRFREKQWQLRCAERKKRKKSGETD